MNGNKSSEFLPVQGGKRAHTGYQHTTPFKGSKIVNEYDQEIPQSQTADNPVAP